MLSGLEDEEFRSRAYALGVDLFWLKADMQRNTQMFLDCLESLLGAKCKAAFAASKAKASWTSSRWNVFRAARPYCDSPAGRSWQSCGFRTAN